MEEGGRGRHIGCCASEEGSCGEGKADNREIGEMPSVGGIDDGGEVDEEFEGVGEGCEAEELRWLALVVDIWH